MPQTFTFTFTPNDDPEEYPTVAIEGYNVVYDGPGDAIEAITGFSSFDRNPVYAAFDRIIDNAIDNGETSVTIDYTPAIVAVAR